jgi:hypothetical protein
MSGQQVELAAVGSWTCETGRGTPMPRFQISCALVCAGFILWMGAQAHAASGGADNPVIQWNKTLLTIVRTKGAQPATIHPTRSFAILHAAIYDAVNSIDEDHRPYRIHIEGVSGFASRDAAADQAAHDVLVSLYPTFQTTLDTQLDHALSEIPDGANKIAGVDVGRTVAAAFLALRADDGSATTPPPFVFSNVPGRYQSTPPNCPPQPSFRQWPTVRTFVLTRADQFRPGPPPALTSREYTQVFNEVKAVGILGGTCNPSSSSPCATADQALTGTFWNGAIQNYWNEIAQSAAQAKGLNTAQSARLFALLNLSLADSVIAFYDAKYTYNFWRPVTAIRAAATDCPVTAIRAAATDGNPATAPDPNWLPEVTNTAADPSYPGAHAVISSAAAFVLADFFRTNRFNLTVTSEVMPGVNRPFDSFGDAEKEASLSRIFAGVHFRSDENAGEVLGRLVADYVTDHALKPVWEGDDDHEE